MAKNANQNANNVDKVILAGAAVAALAATGYLLFGPNGKKNRGKLGAWATKMMDDVTEQLKQAKEVTEPMYHRIVDEVAKKYETRDGVSKQELQAVVTDMKRHWQDLARNTKIATKKSKA